ncbi:hypothetical protein BH11MYX4_BH11MYX4_58440 [soil metagenome]
MSDEKPSKDEKKGDTSATAPSEEPAPVVETAASTEEADDDEVVEDSAGPEAIARRVAALGEEDENEVKAREEERKLAERKASKKKGKKGGLEVAASKKLSKIGTRAEPKRQIAVAADADPLIEKTAKLSEWAKQNQKTVQIVGALIAVALLGVAGFLYIEHKNETEASTMLTKAVEDERARVGEPPKEDAENPVELPLMFKTFEERRESALKKFREVQSKYPKTGAAILSRLAEGSLLLDKHEPDPALAAFTDVKGSALAAADPEVKGRALEGMGFAYELKAAAAPADAAKNYDEALKVYKELENTVEVRGFKETAQYHQARVTLNKGEKDKAKELLVALRTAISKPDDNPSNLPQGPAFPYLKEVATDRLREIDPASVPKVPQMGPGGAGGSPQLSPAQIKKMMEEMQRKQKSGGDPHGAGGH